MRQLASRGSGFSVPIPDAATKGKQAPTGPPSFLHPEPCMLPFVHLTVTNTNPPQSQGTKRSNYFGISMVSWTITCLCGLFYFSPRRLKSMRCIWGRERGLGRVCRLVMGETGGWDEYMRSSAAGTEGQLGSCPYRKRKTDTEGPWRGYELDESCGTSCHWEIDKTKITPAFAHSLTCCVIIPHLPAVSFL